MSISPAASHHRRRSSVLTGAGGGPSQPPAVEQREDPGHKREEQKPSAADDADISDLSSIAENEEERYLSSSDDCPDDEETGLTANQRRQRHRRRKQRRQLDARIAGVKGPRDPFSLSSADRTVVQRLLINVGLILLWYFFSLAISIYNKWMFSRDDNDNEVFPFPLFTTSLHMAVQFTLSSLILLFIPSLRPQAAASTSGSPDRQDTSESRPLLTKWFYFTRLVPCGTATSLDIGLGNMSLKFITLTFLTMCKSSALAFVLLFAFVFGLETMSVRLVAIIATMTMGVVMMVAGETAFNAVGFVLIIASAFFSGFRWGLTQILLLRHPATSNPFSTLFFLTPVMFFSLIIIALAVEGPSEIVVGFTALTDAHGLGPSILLLVFPGVLAFCMISSEFALLQRSSVVTLSICGIFKEVVTITAAGVVFHDKLTAVNVTGLVVTIGSIASYNYMKISKMRSEAKQNNWESNPNSDSEYGSVPRNQADYQQISDPETSELLPSDFHLNEDVNINPPHDSTAGRSFPALTTAPSSNIHNLTISTSNLSDHGHGPTHSPLISSPSPLKSAPAIIISMEDEIQKPAGRSLSPNENAQSSSGRGSPAGSH
ncbi:triose-phosphate transporter family-domain-containing protein [Aspergillus cavernicola]|uniref:Triose-phosphate transporter family-domain-containing protein n=1 Tax=Aspergillus cavernicola TaxID=176166 RepID=A0ABR4HZT3_9EURO